MSQLRKITLSSQLAETLRREIEAGQWTGKLPGYRVLGQRHAVSRPVVEAALRELAAAGWIGSGGIRGRWAILHEGEKQVATTGIAEVGLLLWITGESPQSLDQAAQALLAHCRGEWEKRGGRMTVAVVDFARMRNPGAQLKTLVKRHGASRILLHNGPKEVIRAAAALGLPLFALGGEIGTEYQGDGVGIPLAKTLEPVISRFRQMGRKRIMVPVRAGMEAWRQGVVTALGEGAEVTGAVPEAWVPVIHHNFPEAIHAQWETLLCLLKPDAVLMMDPLWVISLYGAAWRLGIKPGADLLVVTSNSLTPLEWLPSPPVMLRIPHQKIRDHIVRWIRKPGGPGALLRLAAEWPDPA